MLRLAPYTGFDFNPATGRYETRVKSRVTFSMAGGLFPRDMSELICTVALAAGPRVAVKMAQSILSPLK